MFFDIIQMNIGVSPSGKATGSDPVMRRFESYYPSQIFMGCKLMIKNNQGVTLVSLIILIIILATILGLSAYNINQSIDSTRVEAFTTEYKIMQSQVNLLYEKMKNNEEVTVNGAKYKGSGNTEKGIQEIGNTIEGENEPQATKVFDSLSMSENDRKDYRYYSLSLIKDGLGIEGITQDFLVNMQTRDILSYKGLEHNENIYYNLNGLSGELYNVKYDAHKGVPTFTSDVEIVTQDKEWRINITDIQYDGYIDTWKAKYKTEEEQNWKISDSLKISVDKTGIYDVKVFNGDIESEAKKVNVNVKYETDKIIAYFDARNNTGYGHSNTATTWKDLSGNNFNVVFYNMNLATTTSTSGWLKDSILFDGQDDYAAIQNLDFSRYNDLTICATFKVLDYPKSPAIYSAIICLATPGAGRLYMGYSHSGDLFRHNFTTPDTWSSGGKFVLGKKEHLIGTYKCQNDNSKNTLYENGTKLLENNTKMTTKWANYPVEIARSWGGFDGNYSNACMQLYDLTIYNGTLTEQQIKEHSDLARITYDF